MLYRLSIASLMVASAAVVALLSPADTRQERLSRHINLGKAFYENPGTQKEAVEQFRQALALNPSSAREHLNYGLALLRAGATKEGVAEIEKARSIDRSLPHPYFNLGVVFKREGDFPRALKEFEQMARLVPDEPITHYNLGTLYKLEGQTEKALGEFQTAARLDPTLAAPHFQLFNAYRVAKRTEDAQRELAIFQELKKRQSELGTSEDMDWSYYSEILETIPPANAPVEAVSESSFADQRLGSVGTTGQGIAALDADADGRLDIIAWSADRVVLFRNTPKGFVAAPIPGAAGPVAVGDFNNDGFPDLCAGSRLVTNRKGALSVAEKPLHPAAVRKCVWIDYDHDYDLDLLLLGGSQVLLRNNGDGSWTDVSSSFPFVPGQAVDAAVLELGEGSNSFDVVVAYEGRAGVVYRDRKMGKYEASPLAFALAAPLEVGDFNRDGFLDLASAGRFIENHGGTLRQGGDLPKRPPGGALGDFNGDGLNDFVMVRPDGGVHLLRNTDTAKNASMKIGLTGVKNLKLAFGARVEVKAGSLYQKKLYAGVPLVFELPGYTQADTVRITWPNGLIQNELRQNAGASYNYKEAQRLSGSCPMIFTWNGREFEFISDVLGVAPLGTGLPVDHDEYILLSGRQLQPRNGMYEVRVTEELREVSYLDQIKLVAVDHPAGIEIVTNEKFKSLPFPDFRLYGVERRLHPMRAQDQQGRDVLDRIVRRDARYVDSFQRDLAGRAEMHFLTLELPKSGVLYLNGWVDWADGSVFVAAAQNQPLRAPYLQVKDNRSKWVTVIEDMGLPAGKPRTIAVDLTGKFLSDSREVRIVTNMCVYWDEIFLGEDNRPPEARLTDVVPEGAELRFRGFSAVQVHPERLQPERFLYTQVRLAAMWNPTPGYYTRYGDVRTLLESSDDRFVVMGAGDELRLLFPARGLPTVPPGWTRDFLLYFDGWAKDADANTELGSTVEPLPFHAMRSYPDSDPRRPDTDYQRTFNTRPALRLIRPLYGSR